MRGEAAAIAVDAQVFDMQFAGGRIEPAARAADVDQRLPCAASPAGRRCGSSSACSASGGAICGSDSGQRGSSNGSSLFGRSSVALRTSQRIQPQAPAEQRPDRRIQHDGLRGEHDAAGRAGRGSGRHAIRIDLARHREAHAMQRHRPGRRAFRASPGQRGPGRQPRDDLRQQQIAAADRGQQPPQRTTPATRSSASRCRRPTAIATRARAARARAGVAFGALFRRQRYASHGMPLTGRRRC